jgi:hypothetical protein
LILKWIIVHRIIGCLLESSISDRDQWYALVKFNKRSNL